MKKLSEILKFVKRIIFPPSCVFCRRIIEINSRTNACGKCGDSIEFTSEKVCCKKCGKPVVGYNEKQLCYFCLNTSAKYFDKIASVFIYDGLVRDSILRFKINGYSNYADTYADCMMAKFFEEYNDITFDLICGAPSHDKKAKKKDFDHVDLLCKRLGKLLNLEYKKRIFLHLRNTEKQSSLGYDDRQKNMKNSLDVLPELDLTGKNILLIDDICTTRATIIECSRALKSAGAKKVFALTLATVNNPK